MWPLVHPQVHNVSGDWMWSAWPGQPLDVKSLVSLLHAVHLQKSKINELSHASASSDLHKL